MMTADEWLACAGSSDTGEMQDLLRGRASPRQLRLFAVACARRVEHRMGDFRSSAAVDTAEKYADREAGKSELSRRWQDAETVLEYVGDEGDGPMESEILYNAALAAYWAAMPLDVSQDPVEIASHTTFYALRASPGRNEPIAQADLLCNILGAEAGGAKMAISWRTSVVLALAEGVYADRAFDRLPILADALQEAGCDDADLLDHCRGPGSHARGCWVVDLILGKT